MMQTNVSSFFQKSDIKKSLNTQLSNKFHANFSESNNSISSKVKNTENVCSNNTDYIHHDCVIKELKKKHFIETKDYTKKESIYPIETSDDEIINNKIPLRKLRKKNVSRIIDDDTSSDSLDDNCIRDDSVFVTKNKHADENISMGNTKNSENNNVEHCKKILTIIENENDFSNASPKMKKTVTVVKSNTSSSLKYTIPSDEKLLEEYNKNSNSSRWDEKRGMPYATLCQSFSDIELITSRLEIQRILTDLFRLSLLKQPSDILALVYLASNTVAAAYECVELGIGDSILIKAISETSGSKPGIIKQKYEKEGDLGTVVQSFQKKQRTLGFGAKPKPLTIQEVLTVFRQISITSGTQSQKWKVDKIKGLLVRANEGPGIKYIIRGLQGKLRIGLAQSTVLISLAHAMTLSLQRKSYKSQPGINEDYSYDNDFSKKYNKFNLIEVDDRKLESAVDIVKKAYSETSSYDKLVNTLLKVGLEGLGEHCTLTPGMPVEPMLAKPTKSLQEVLKRLSGKRFTCEFKYDGERAQVHMSSDGIMKVFSRSLLNTSEKFPEVLNYVKDSCTEMDPSCSFVLDTEVVAYNRETYKFVPFQVLSTRKKTGTENEDDVKVKVIVLAFDLMFLNGKSLLNETLSVRRRLLYKHFKPVDGRFQFATSMDHEENGDTSSIDIFLGNAIKGQCEGLMIKTLDENATYQPSNRSLNWLKLKKDYLDGMGDSFDLVPIGAYYGRGKRMGIYGAYLLACYDIDTEEFQSVCKVGTGFSDEDLRLLCQGLKEHIIPEKTSQYHVSESLECDIWFSACQVWEVKAADLSKSSTHKGGIYKLRDSGRGIGLRFPRFERFRKDKKVEHATSSEQILEMYYTQDSIVEERREGEIIDDDGI